MKVREAWGELGLEPPCSADQIRRAYLRRLKSRNPEADREGFLRLREAYELVSSVNGFSSEEEEEDAPSAEDARSEATVSGEPPTSDGPGRAASEAAAPPPPVKIDLDDPVASARVLIEAFERFRTDPTRGAPHPIVGLRVFLALLEARKMKTAGELHGSLAQLVESMGASRAFGPRATIWALAESLWNQRHEIQREAFIPMAEAIGELQPHRAAAALRAFARSERAEARWLYHHLDVHAPELFQLFGPALLPPGAEPSPAQVSPPPQTPKGRSPVPWIGGFGAALFVLFRIAAIASRPGAPDSPSYPGAYRGSPATELDELSRAATEMANRGACADAVAKRNAARELAGLGGNRIPIDSRNDYEQMEILVDNRCSAPTRRATSVAAPK